MIHHHQYLFQVLKTDAEILGKLLPAILKRGPDAYEKFCDALSVCGTFNYVIQHFAETEGTTCLAKTKRDIFSAVQPQIYKISYGKYSVLYCSIRQFNIGKANVLFYL